MLSQLQKPVSFPVKEQRRDTSRPHVEYFGSMATRESIPTISRLRPVLVMMDFPAVRHLATEIGYSDIMEITRRDVYPPALTEIEETAAYTFSKLVHPSRLLRVTVGGITF